MGFNHRGTEEGFFEGLSLRALRVSSEAGGENHCVFAPSRETFFLKIFQKSPHRNVLINMNA